MKKILAFLPLVLPRVSSRCKHLYHRLVHHREAFGGSMHKRFGHEDIRLPKPGGWRYRCPIAVYFAVLERISSVASTTCAG
jgi:hypothetical protein